MADKLSALPYSDKVDVLESALKDLGEEDRANINWYVDQILTALKAKHPNAMISREQILEVLAAIGIKFLGRAK